MHYQTSLTWLGLPLIHLAFGKSSAAGDQRGRARGWIAVGDQAVGLLAIGGLAVGGVALGGVAIGGITWGGLAIGLGAVGGAAVGLQALAGLAVGWQAAMGGLAIAQTYAQGGIAIATHANDVIATDYLAAAPFFIYASWINRLLPWILGISSLGLLLSRRINRR